MVAAALINLHMSPSNSRPDKSYRRDTGHQRRKVRVLAPKTRGQVALEGTAELALWPVGEAAPGSLLEAISETQAQIPQRTQTTPYVSLR